MAADVLFKNMDDFMINDVKVLAYAHNCKSPYTPLGRKHLQEFWQANIIVLYPYTAMISMTGYLIERKEKIHIKCKGVCMVAC